MKSEPIKAKSKRKSDNKKTACELFAPLTEKRETRGIEYRITRTNGRTLSLRVSADGKVSVRAYKCISERDVEQFVIRKEGWIKRKIAEANDRPRPPALSDGANVSIAGRACIIRIIDGIAPEIVGQTAFLPRGDEACGLEKLAKSELLAYAYEKCGFYSEHFGFKYKNIKITSAKTRWGSCGASDTINYSFRLAFLPTRLIDYVIVHELCHTRERNHKAAFHKETASVLPDYKALDGELSRYALYCDFPPH